MSDPGPEQGAPAGGGPSPSEEDRSEIDQRAAYEAELSRITAVDMIAQATVSLLNIGAHRLGPPGGEDAAAGGAGDRASGAPARDLEQVRDAVDAVSALLKVLERRIPPAELRGLRDALSRLQLAYAQEASSGGPAGAQAQRATGDPAAGTEEAAGAHGEGQAPAGAQTPPAAGPGEAAPGGDARRPGPAESSGRLWVPSR